MDDHVRDLRIEDREFEEALEEANAQLGRATRGLDEVALEFMHRGDKVRIAVGPHAWTGNVMHAGRCLVTLRTEGNAIIDVDLGSITSIAVVRRATAGGRAPGHSEPATLRARLRELERTGDEVEVGGPNLEVVLRVVAVAQTHIEAEGIDGTEWVIPLRSIGYVIRNVPSRTSPI